MCTHDEGGGAQSERRGDHGTAFETPACHGSRWGRCFQPHNGHIAWEHEKIMDLSEADVILPFSGVVLIFLPSVLFRFCLFALL